MNALALVLLLAQAPAAPQAASPQSAPEPPPYRITGVVFGDYYAFAQHHLDNWDGQHGLWLRRLYLTYDHTLSPKLALRFRLEANSNGKLAGGALTPYIKDAYLRWNFSGRQALMLGIQPTLSFEFVETVWGLRHIEKAPVDLYRMDSSRDLALMLSGPLNASQTVKYAVQFGNDSGTGSETDEHKGFRAAARYEPKQGFAGEVMVAQFSRPTDADRTMAQVFGAWRGSRGRAGAHYTYQKRRAAAGDTELNLVSGFGVVDLKPRTLWAFARVDRVTDPCGDCAAIDYLPIAPTHPFTFVLAGLDYALHPQVRVSPNVEWVGYSERDGVATKPSNDTVVRLTFSFAW